MDFTAANKFSVPLTFPSPDGGHPIPPSSSIPWIPTAYGMNSYVPFWDRNYERIRSGWRIYPNGGKVISLDTAEWPMKQTISLDMDEELRGTLAAKYLLRFKRLRSYMLVTVRAVSIVCG